MKKKPIDSMEPIRPHFPCHERNPIAPSMMPANTKMSSPTSHMPVTTAKLLFVVLKPAKANAKNAIVSAAFASKQRSAAIPACGFSEGEGGGSLEAEIGGGQTSLESLIDNA
jgi:hypothetical protein